MCLMPLFDVIVTQCGSYTGYPTNLSTAADASGNLFEMNTKSVV